MKKKPSLLLRPFNLTGQDTWGHRKDLLFLACADGEGVLVTEDHQKGNVKRE